MVNFVTAYGPKQKVTLTCTTPGRTKQQFKAECDINNIVSRFLKTGVMDFVNKHQPQYGDVTGLDFRGALDIVARAEEMFRAMPARQRARFENEPAQFLDFIQNPANAEEARALGLLKPVAPPPAGAATPPAGAPAASSSGAGNAT